MNRILQANLYCSPMASKLHGDGKEFENIVSFVKRGLKFMFPSCRVFTTHSTEAYSINDGLLSEMGSWKKWNVVSLKLRGRRYGRRGGSLCQKRFSGVRRLG